MYSWPAYVMSAIVVEIPFNIASGSVFFFCWYWTVGFPRESGRVGYAYLLYMLFELYYATFAQWVAALSPNPMSASILFSTFFSFVIIVRPLVSLWSDDADLTIDSSMESSFRPQRNFSLPKFESTQS